MLIRINSSLVVDTDKVEVATLNGNDVPIYAAVDIRPRSEQSYRRFSAPASDPSENGKAGHSERKKHKKHRFRKPLTQEERRTLVNLWDQAGGSITFAELARRADAIGVRCTDYTASKVIRDAHPEIGSRSTRKNADRDKKAPAEMDADDIRRDAYLVRRIVAMRDVGRDPDGIARELGLRLHPLVEFLAFHEGT